MVWTLEAPFKFDEFLRTERFGITARARARERERERERDEIRHNCSNLGGPDFTQP